MFPELEYSNTLFTLLSSSVSVTSRLKGSKIDVVVVWNGCNHLEHHLSKLALNSLSQTFLSYIALALHIISIGENLNILWRPSIQARNSSSSCKSMAFALPLSSHFRLTLPREVLFIVISSLLLYHSLTLSPNKTKFFCSSRVSMFL